MGGSALGNPIYSVVHHAEALDTNLIGFKQKIIFLKGGKVKKEPKGRSATRP
jgi:hypothetical protein